MMVSSFIFFMIKATFSIEFWVKNFLYFTEINIEVYYEQRVVTDSSLLGG